MVLGPRFLIEAGFIVAVAVVAGIADLSTWSIIGVVAAAWILVALVELAMWARHARTAKGWGQAPAGPDPSSALPEAVVIRAESPRVAAAPPVPEPEVLPYLPTSDGPLPADFDGLVRDAFGDLLRVVAT